MKPNISEFSYGYALTEELVKGLGTEITTAPVFPSLYDEGKEGGGWDLKLQKGGIPLFIQFKLSHYLKNANAKERKSGHFSSPYYRMHIRPIHQSKQHELLLNLESSGHEVYYVAPAFHKPNELDNAYLNRTVKDRSVWIKPSDIGNITDNKEYYVVFQLPSTYYFCSKPKIISRNLSFSTALEEILSALSKKREDIYKNEITLHTEETHNIETKPNIRSIEEQKQNDKKEEDIRTLTMSNAVEQPLDNREFQEHKKIVNELYSNRHPIELVSYYSSIYLDSQLMIVQ